MLRGRVWALGRMRAGAGSHKKADEGGVSFSQDISSFFKYYYYYYLWVFFFETESALVHDCAIVPWAQIKRRTLNRLSHAGAPLGGVSCSLSDPQGTDNAGSDRG